VAQYGPDAAGWRVGNIESSRFGSLGRKVAELLDLLVGGWGLLLAARCLLSTAVPAWGGGGGGLRFVVCAV